MLRYESLNSRSRARSKTQRLAHFRAPGTDPRLASLRRLSGWMSNSLAASSNVHTCSSGSVVIRGP